MNKSNVDSVLSHFRLFLERSFDHIDSIYLGDQNEEDSKNDWLQANWELLVERMICKPSESLIEYGVGADFYDTSSRVFLPDAIPTHKITVHSRYGRKVANLLDSKLLTLEDPELDLDFDSFCYSHGGFYYPFQAPLNSVLLTGKHDLVTVSLSCVTFKKTPIKNKYF